jgi:hypothetical protein
MDNTDSNELISFFIFCLAGTAIGVICIYIVWQLDKNPDRKEPNMFLTFLLGMGFLFGVGSFSLLVILPFMFLEVYAPKLIIPALLVYALLIGWGIYWGVQPASKESAKTKKSLKNTLSEYTRKISPNKKTKLAPVLAGMICSGIFLTVVLAGKSLFSSPTETREASEDRTNIKTSYPQTASASIAPFRSPQPPGSPTRLLTADPELQQIYEELSHLFGDMPIYPVMVRDTPIEDIKGYPRVAEFLCKSGYTKKDCWIEIRKEYLEKSPREKVINTMKHEMTHAWLWWKGMKDDHGDEFKKKLASVGGTYP